MSGDNGFGAFTEKDYNSESLRFIYKHKTDFVPVLTKIVPLLNKNEYVMQIANNSNLQNLIVKLTEYTITIDKKGEKTKIIVDHKDNISAYVKRCIELMNVKPTKDNIHNLFLLCRKDIKNNNELQEMVTSLKKDNDWKKMVGMLIPKGASVKLHIDGGDLMEQSTNNWVSSDKHVSIGDNIEGNVVERFYRSGSKISGYKFKKIVKIPEGLVGHVYTSNKGTNFIEVDPEAIQLIESEPTKGTVEKGKAPATTEASGEAVVASGAVTPTAKTVTPAATEASGLPGAKTGATEEAGAVVAAVVAAAATAETEGATGATAETVATTAAQGAATAETEGATVSPVLPGVTEEAVVASGEKGTETTGSQGAAATAETEGARGATAAAATGAAETAAQGGSQRLTRKNKKSIGAVRKTRTNH